MTRHILFLDKRPALLRTNIVSVNAVQCVFAQEPESCHYGEDGTSPGCEGPDYGAWDCGVDEEDVEGDYVVPEDHCGVVLWW